jgi:hypothetical protein
MIPPVVWIPAAFAVGLFLVLWGGMSWAYERGGRHVREELEADRAARAFRRMPRVPPHEPLPGPGKSRRQLSGPGRPIPPERRMHPVYRNARRAEALPPLPEHERQALQLANAEPDDTSDFTRGMAAMVAEGMAAVDAYLEGWQP